MKDADHAIDEQTYRAFTRYHDWEDGTLVAQSESTGEEGESTWVCLCGFETRYKEQAVKHLQQAEAQGEDVA